jgi:hypothetical protein
MIAIEIERALDGITSALDTLSKLDLESLDATERLQLAQRCETVDRRNTVLRNDIALSLTHCDIADLGDRADKVLADCLRITPTEARRRIATTQPLTARTVISQTLPPAQPATAKAWRRGELDEQHVRIIQRFFTQLPQRIITDEIAAAEAFLAQKATELRPDQVAKVADRLALVLNPDGIFNDNDRAADSPGAHKTPTA